MSVPGSRLDSSAQRVADGQKQQRRQAEARAARAPGQQPHEHQARAAGERHGQAQRHLAQAEDRDERHGQVAQQRVLPAAPALQQHGQGVAAAVYAVAEDRPGVVARARLVLVQPEGERVKSDKPRGEAQRQERGGAYQLRAAGYSAFTGHSCALQGGIIQDILTHWRWKYKTVCRTAASAGAKSYNLQFGLETRRHMRYNTKAVRVRALPHTSKCKYG